MQNLRARFHKRAATPTTFYENTPEHDTPGWLGEHNTPGWLGTPTAPNSVCPTTTRFIPIESISDLESKCMSHVSKSNWRSFNGFTIMNVRLDESKFKSVYLCKTIRCAQYVMKIVRFRDKAHRQMFKLECLITHRMANAGIAPKVHAYYNVYDGSRAKFGVMIMDRMPYDLESDKILALWRTKNLHPMMTCAKLRVKMDKMHSMGVFHGSLFADNVWVNNNGEPFIANFDTAVLCNQAVPIRLGLYDFASLLHGEQRIRRYPEAVIRPLKARLGAVDWSLYSREDFRTFFEDVHNRLKTVTDSLVYRSSMWY